MSGSDGGVLPSAATSIGAKTYRRLSDKPRAGALVNEHWEEMTRFLDERPDQTALELLVEFQARYPAQYRFQQLHTLQQGVKTWRQQAVQRLIHQVTSNIPGEATGNKLT